MLDPYSRLRASAFSFVLPVAIGVALVALAIVGWLQGVVPAVEARITRATGHRAQIGSLSPRWRGLTARDVVLYGAPPFEGAPLARVARVEIDIGGSWLAPRARAVTVDGALVTYLAIGIGKGAVDNLRGSRTTAPARAPRSGEAPAVRVIGSRLEAFVRLPGPDARRERPGLIVRSERLDGTRSPAGELDLRLGGAVVDLPGFLTVRAAKLESKGRAGELRVIGRDVALAIPGGGTLVAAPSVELVSRAGAIAVTATRAPDGSLGGRVAGRARLGSQGLADVAELALELTGVPLGALQPVVSRWGFSVGGGQADLALDLNEVRGDGQRELGFRLDVRDLDLHHPRLDRTPWTDLDLRVRGGGRYAAEGGNRALTITEVELHALGLGTRASGSLRWPARVEAGGVKGELRLEPPRAGASDCAGGLAAWPRPVRERLGGLAVAGRIAPHARLGFEAGKWDEIELGFSLDPICAVTAEPTVIAELVRGGEAAALRALGRVGVAAGDFVPLGRLPRVVVAAFLTAEDAAFRRHDGFDLEMVRRALAHDLAMGAFAKGASTLTQQLTKNLFLSQERTLARKLAELILTWRIEAALGKDRILELYLNVVELGPGIRGIGRAATTYFGKPAAELTPLEAAHLAALLPNPIGFARRFRDGRVDDGWLIKLYDLLGRMRRGGALSERELVAARASSLTLRRF